MSVYGFRAEISPERHLKLERIGWPRAVDRFHKLELATKIYNDKTFCDEDVKKDVMRMARGCCNH
jgi:hypothetical protein